MMCLRKHSYCHCNQALLPGKVSFYASESDVCAGMQASAMPALLGGTGAGAVQAVNLTLVVIGTGAANTAESARNAIRAALSRLVPGIGALAAPHCLQDRKIVSSQCAEDA